MKKKKTDIETFIFIHNQDIILKFEQTKKFSDLSCYTYVFLGNGPTDKLKNIENLIIATDFEDNLEQYPNMCAYSGWYLLYRNKLIKTKYVTLLEYDVVLTVDFEKRLKESLTDDINIYGYVPVGMDGQLLYVSGAKSIINYYNSNFNIDLRDNITKICIRKNIDRWISTSNVTLNSDFFHKYMDENVKLFQSIAYHKLVGHAIERLLSMYYIINDIPVLIIDGVLYHYQLDSHFTQPIISKKFYDLNVDLISENIITARR